MDVGIVLSHRLENGEPSSEYLRRLDLAIKLFKENKIKNIILCSETATDRILNYCAKRGVPRKNIFLETKSRDTIGEAFFIKKDLVLIYNWTDIAVISSDYHIDFRAKEIFEFIYPRENLSFFKVNTNRNNEKKEDQENSLKKFRELFRGIIKGDDKRIENRLFEKHDLYKKNGRKNVLAIGAHFDDIELGCGGTIAKHIKKGDKVYYLYITNGSYNLYNGNLLRNVDEAYKEGLNAAKILGIKEENFICLNYETKKVTYGVELIEKLNEIIDDKNIDTIYTHWDKDVHQDHSAIGKATINAARHIKRVLMYRSNWYHSTSIFNERYFVDISDFMSVKIKAIRAHKGELEKRGESWINFVKHQNENRGIGMGTKYAEAFEIVKYMD